MRIASATVRVGAFGRARPSVRLDRRGWALLRSAAGRPLPVTVQAVLHRPGRTAVRRSTG